MYLFFIAPGLVPLSEVSGSAHDLLPLNPLTGLFEAYRDVLLYGPTGAWQLLFPIACGRVLLARRTALPVGAAPVREDDRAGSDAAIHAHGLGVQFLFDRHQRVVTPALSRIRRRGAETWGLRDLGFDGRTRGAMALLGASGAGKTTLLRLIAGVLVPTRARWRWTEGSDRFCRSKPA